MSLILPKRKKEQGFTLIELLIALLIAALSALGFAYTQTKSLQYGRSSGQFTMASIQASNTIEQMWGSLCSLKDGTKTLNSLSIANGFTRDFSPQAFQNEMSITITSTDTRLTDVIDTVEVKVIFPDICS